MAVSLGTIPDLSRIPSLQVFKLAGNELKGTLPSFRNNTQLERLSLQMNHLEGSIPSLQLPKLNVMDLSRNRLSGSIDPLTSIPNVTLINLSWNQLSGYIPPVFENFFGLRSVLLSNNKLEGTIPKGIWELNQLIVVDLSSNQFTGDIGPFLVPEDIGSEFESAKYIYLDNNQFFGKLDWWLLVTASQIEEISIRNNKITHLGDLTTSNLWKRIDLSGNPLFGTIPNSYHRFIELQQISLINTSLHHDNSTLLPSFTRFGDPYNLLDKRSLYVCPSVVTKVQNLGTDINIEPRYYDFAACECLPNYFGQAGKCVQCPRECDCVDGVSLKGCYVTPNVESITAVERCAQPESCVLRLRPVTAEESGVPVVDQDCGEGYEDQSCSKCGNGYGHVGRTCIKCNDTTKYVSISLGLYFLLCYVIHLYKLNDNYSAKLRILMFHGQTLSILASVVPGSSQVNSAVDWSYSIGSLHVPNVECVLGSNSMIDSFIFSLIRILIIYSVSMIIYMASPRIRVKIVIVLLQLLFLFYFGIACHVFAVIGCTVYDSGRDTWYLNAAPWIECNPVSGEFETLRAIMIPTAIIYVLGLPLYAWWCLRNRYSGIGSSEQKIAFFYLIYKDKYWYWELVIIARRLAFAFATSVIPFTYPGVLFSSIVFIIQVSIWLQMKYEPYAAKDENGMELMSLQVIFLSFFLALLANLLEQEDWISYLIISTNAVTFLWFIYDSILVPSIQFIKGGTGSQTLLSLFAQAASKADPDQDDAGISIGLSALTPRDLPAGGSHFPTLPTEQISIKNSDADE